MDAYRIEDCIAQASIGIARSKALRIDDGRGIEVSVVYGSVWITQHRDPTDVCLAPGESFRIGRDGATIIEAFAPSLVTLTPHAPSDRVMHVSLLRTGPAPVRLLDGERPRRSGRLDGWLERFWAGLFVPSARPTTAAF
jgi:hypothetical protein